MKPIQQDHIGVVFTNFWPIFKLSYMLFGIHKEMVLKVPGFSVTLLRFNNMIESDHYKLFEDHP